MTKLSVLGYTESEIKYITPDVLDKVQDTFSDHLTKAEIARYVIYQETGLHPGASPFRPGNFVYRWVGDHSYQVIRLDSVSISDANQGLIWTGVVTDGVGKTMEAKIYEYEIAPELFNFSDRPHVTKTLLYNMGYSQSQVNAILSKFIDEPNLSNTINNAPAYHDRSLIDAIFWFIYDVYEGMTPDFDRTQSPRSQKGRFEKLGLTEFEKRVMIHALSHFEPNDDAEAVVARYLKEEIES